MIILNFRSSWEAIFYYLNKTYQYETIRIPYILESNNSEHVYIADFYDPITNTIYEVKPDRLMYNIQKDKYECIKRAVINSGYNFVHIGDEWKGSIYDKDIIDLKDTEIYKLFKPRVYNEN